MQVGLLVEVASNRGERRNGAPESLQPKAAGQHTSGTRGCPLLIYG